MATINDKAFRVTDTTREFLQNFIVEPIPEDTKYVLASSEGYMFFDEDPGLSAEEGHLRIPRMIVLSYYDIEYETE